MINPILALAQSAPVTNWPVRLLLVALVVAIIGLVLWGMLRGWRHRLRRQADLREPSALPDPLPDTLPAGAESTSGVYLGSVIAGDWLDRVAAHGLGTRSRVAVVTMDTGVALLRTGARSFFIPAHDVVAVRRERGIAGKAFEKDALVVITWMLGEQAIDSGIRPDHADDAERLVVRVHSLAGYLETRSAHGGTSEDRVRMESRENASEDG